jgi:hypothetical protein
VFFTLSGAEANENAIKIARMVTGRLKMVSRYRSYHGASLGALTLTGDWRRVPLEPGIPGVVHVPDCYCDRCPFGKTLATCQRECATHIGSVLRLEGAGTVAGVILEPVPGANGALVPPPEYWPIVRAATEADGALLIADEVLTGFGRTGTAFGFQHWGVTPDLITVAKGLASGYATIGAVIVHDRVARHFDDHVLACGLTYYAHPLACAAAVETLKVYEDEQLFARSAALGPVLLRELRAVAAAWPARPSCAAWASWPRSRSRPSQRSGRCWRASWRRAGCRSTSRARAAGPCWRRRCVSPRPTWCAGCAPSARPPASPSAPRPERRASYRLPRRLAGVRSRHDAFQGQGLGRAAGARRTDVDARRHGGRRGHARGGRPRRRGARGAASRPR